ncbi:ATP-binding protein [Niallia oryzisoli]|uniref:ATP-binding protein n=1 Tax=Niallia oryzisoli TaxID=1737571 RepID=A0ABZ2CEC6_9BACI
MKRDITVVPVNERESLVIASDNSGGIGLKESDLVQAPYEIVSYFSLRVAAMECIAAGGEPFSVFIHNFCEEKSWQAIIAGVERGLDELGMKSAVQISGSTESNFQLLQSALGTIVMGKRNQEYMEKDVSIGAMKLAVIGSPLVGEEVLDRRDEVLPLSLFKDMSLLNGVVLLPVGSKGIFHELKVMTGDEALALESISCDVDLLKTSGPSTCILAAFPALLEPVVKEMAAGLYHSLEIEVK